MCVCVCVCWGGGLVPIFLRKPIATCDFPVPLPSASAHAVQIQRIKQQPTDESLRSWLSNKFKSRCTEKTSLGSVYPLTFANSLDISGKFLALNAFLFLVLNMIY